MSHAVGRRITFQAGLYGYKVFRQQTYSVIIDGNSHYSCFVPINPQFNSGRVITKESMDNTIFNDGLQCEFDHRDVTPGYG